MLSAKVYRWLILVSLFIVQIILFQNCSSSKSTSVSEKDPSAQADGAPLVAKSVAVGTGMTCAITLDSKVKCWGLRKGALAEKSAAPEIVPGLTGVIQITVGGGHACALTSDRYVYCWGAGNFGQTAVANLTSSGLTASLIGGVNDVAQVAAGGSHTCALTRGGEVWCWGRNSEGQLGNNQVDGKIEYGAVLVNVTPVKAIGLTDMKQVATGLDHTCAVTSASTVWCWGKNSSNQLGYNAGQKSIVPNEVPALDSVSLLVAGQNHNCVLSANVAKCWGANESGQLGDGTLANSEIPKVVSGLTYPVQLSAGSHSCAALVDGSALCWGANDSGQLGSMNPNSKVPAAVAGLQVSGGIFASFDAHSCAITTGKNVKCWGKNSEGQLGNGTYLNTSVPTNVLEPVQ